MKKILLIVTIAFTMNVNARVDMFSEGGCLSGTRVVVKQLHKMQMPRDEIIEIFGEMRIHQLLNVDCLSDVNLLIKRLVILGFTKDEAIGLVNGRMLYEINKMLDDLFK